MKQKKKCFFIILHSIVTWSRWDACNQFVNSSFGKHRKLHVSLLVTSHRGKLQLFACETRAVHALGQDLDGHLQGSFNVKCSNPSSVVNLVQALQLAVGVGIVCTNRMSPIAIKQMKKKKKKKKLRKILRKKNSSTHNTPCIISRRVWREQLKSKMIIPTSVQERNTKRTKTTILSISLLGITQTTNKLVLEKTN